ncbi:MAG: hypothetical protein P8K08_17070 [Fuerstiella sp.]|nr:hypothetical protein [Fuerstiella sp.]
MCIFAQPVVSVTDTNIFARLLPDGWQSVVYQMKFETKENNAIILPLPVQLPVTEENSLQFISLAGQTQFFTDLNDGFPLERPMPESFSRGIDFQVDVQESNLQVHDVGEFIASFVPSIPDFDRLDERFRIPPESWAKIPQYSDFGFAVFRLKSLRGKPHPMAFKFRSRLNDPQGGSVFFPTVHIHDGEVHDREHFDHTLFLQAPEFDKACGKYKQQTRLVADAATGYVRSKWTAGNFCDISGSRGIVAADALVHRLQMRGTLKNADVLANLNLSHARRLSGLSQVEGGVAAVGLAGLWGLKWFCDRRSFVAETHAAKTS